MNFPQGLGSVDRAVFDRDRHHYRVGHLQHLGELLVEADVRMATRIVIGYP